VIENALARNLPGPSVWVYPFNDDHSFPIAYGATELSE